MLRNRLFWGFAFLVLVFALVSAFFSIQIIKNRVIAEAQTRVFQDLNTSKAIVQSQLKEIETVLRISVTRQTFVDSLTENNWPNPEVQNRLEVMRVALNLDFLTMVDADGRVVSRSAPPYNTGDFKLGRVAITRALEGQGVTSLELFSPQELEQEQFGLSEKAFIVLEETPHARPSPKTEENRGMVFFSSVPVKSGGRVVGALYGGRLINKDTKLVDHIQSTVFQNKMVQGLPSGSVTIFLNDARIATTVRLSNGNRAVGTRVSKDVADKVLDNRQVWEGRAFVVKDWYLTAYDPIVDSQDEVIGMIYMGLLESPFTSLIRDTLIRYILISLCGLLFSLVFAYFLAGKISGPLHRLAVAAGQLNKGEYPEPVEKSGAANETRLLIHSFNDMVTALKERESSLREANEKLETANNSLTELNHDYMESVGFISHELKSPLSTIMNYVYLLSEEKLGTLSEKQRKGLKTIDSNVKLLVEMVRHYLNLSRIENGVLNPIPSDVIVYEEVLLPLIDSHQPSLEEKRMVMENLISPELKVFADLNMVREVFENLISNAIKYGKEDGRISVYSEDEGSYIKFHVYNEGEGIPEDKLKTLFQKFSRLEMNKAARTKKGTGLGLFITKFIIDSHGGDIGVTSCLGKDVDFFFTLPKESASMHMGTYTDGPTNQGGHDGQ